MVIVVTGGAGFIGNALIRYLISETAHSVINFDKLNYASQPESLIDIEPNERYSFYQIDITDFDILQREFCKHNPDAVIHLAAESHVDRSISSPKEFIQSNTRQQLD